MAGFLGVCRWFVLFIGLVFFVTKPGSHKPTSPIWPVPLEVTWFKPRSRCRCGFCRYSEGGRDSIHRTEIMAARANACCSALSYEGTELWGLRDHRRGWRCTSRPSGTTGKSAGGQAKHQSPGSFLEVDELRAPQGGQFAESLVGDFATAVTSLGEDLRKPSVKDANTELWNRSSATSVPCGSSWFLASCRTRHQGEFEPAPRTH